MTEPWHFVVFQNEAIEKLGSFMANSYKKNTPEDSFIQKKQDKFKERPLLSSVIIAICMKRQESEKIPELEEVAAVACAVQNMHLTATAYGLGGYWSSGPMIYSDDMKTYLNLGEKDKCLGLFYLGYTENEWPVSHRQPLEYHSEWRTK
jgi:nitroreductase